MPFVEITGLLRCGMIPVKKRTVFSGAAIPSFGTSLNLILGRGKQTAAAAAVGLIADVIAVVGYAQWPIPTKTRDLCMECEASRERESWPRINGSVRKHLPDMAFCDAFMVNIPLRAFHFHGCKMKVTESMWLLVDEREVR